MFSIKMFAANIGITTAKHAIWLNIIIIIISHVRIIYLQYVYTEIDSSIPVTLHRTSGLEDEWIEVLNLNGYCFDIILRGRDWPVVIHHRDWQADLLHILRWDVENDGLIIDRVECVLFGGRLPLLQSPTVTYEGDFNIWICGEKKQSESVWSFSDLKHTLAKKLPIFHIQQPNI